MKNRVWESVLAGVLSAVMIVSAVPAAVMAEEMEEAELLIADPEEGEAEISEPEEIEFETDEYTPITEETYAEDSLEAIEDISDLVEDVTEVTVDQEADEEYSPSIGLGETVNVDNWGDLYIKPDKSGGYVLHVDGVDVGDCSQMRVFLLERNNHVIAQIKDGWEEESYDDYFFTQGVTFDFYFYLEAGKQYDIYFDVYNGEIRGHYTATLEETDKAGITEDGLIFKMEEEQRGLSITDYRDTPANLVIPAEINGYPVFNVWDYSFDYNDTIETLTISEGVKELWNFPFIGCGNLRSVTLPSTLERIYNAPFELCPKLRSISFPNGSEYFYIPDGTSMVVSEEGDLVAYFGEEVDTLTIPDTVRDMAPYVLDCSGVKKLYLPYDVGVAFHGPGTLEELHTPNPNFVIDYEGAGIPNSLVLIYGRPSGSLEKSCEEHGITFIPEGEDYDAANEPVELQFNGGGGYKRSSRGGKFTVDYAKVHLGDTIDLSEISAVQNWINGEGTGEEIIGWEWCNQDQETVGLWISDSRLRGWEEPYRQDSSLVRIDEALEFFPIWALLHTAHEWHLTDISDDRIFDFECAGCTATRRVETLEAQNMIYPNSTVIGGAEIEIYDVPYIMEYSLLDAIEASMAGTSSSIRETVTSAATRQNIAAAAARGEKISASLEISSSVSAADQQSLQNAVTDPAKQYICTMFDAKVVVRGEQSGILGTIDRTSDDVEFEIRVPDFAAGKNYYALRKHGNAVEKLSVKVDADMGIVHVKSKEFSAFAVVAEGSRSGSQMSGGNAQGAFIKLNASGTIPMKVGQKCAKVKVLELADGDSVASWTSSNKKIVSVSSSGVLKAGKKAGKKATITVRTKAGATASFVVKVQKGKVAAKKITVASKKITLKKGKTFNLAPQVLPITTADKLKCTTSNKKIATVSSKGVIKAKKKGKAKITLKAGKKKVVVTVTVK